MVGNGRPPRVDLTFLLVALFFDIRRHQHERLVRGCFAVPRRRGGECGDTAKDDPQRLLLHFFLLSNSDSEPGANQAKRGPITEWDTVAQEGELRLTKRLGGSVAAQQALVERARGSASRAVLDQPQRADNDRNSGGEERAGEGNAPLRL